MRRVERSGWKRNRRRRRGMVRRETAEHAEEVVRRERGGGEVGVGVEVRFGRRVTIEGGVRLDLGVRARA